MERISIAEEGYGRILKRLEIKWGYTIQRKGGWESGLLEGYGKETPTPWG